MRLCSIQIGRGMKIFLNRFPFLSRKFLLVGTIAMLVSCGGSSGGSSGDDRYPTPTLPGDAARFDNTNANTFASSSVGFIDTLDSVAQLKAEQPVSMPRFIKLVTEQMIKRNRNSGSIAARTEDISAGLCIAGTATADFEEDASSESGTVSFLNCDIGSGILVNGSFNYDTSWNVTSLDYNFQLGGTINFDFGSELVSIVMNSSESGNSGTGDFTGTISFSLSGITGGGFLVQTSQSWTGNALSLQVISGQLIVYGSDNTRLRITVTGNNTADVELDNGNGIFVFDSTINF